jgi:hypothetical protein
MNPVTNFPTSFFSVSFNIILLSTPASLLFRLSHKHFVFLSPIECVLRVFPSTLSYNSLSCFAGDCFSDPRGRRVASLLDRLLTAVLCCAVLCAGTARRFWPTIGSKVRTVRDAGKQGFRCSALEWSQQSASRSGCLEVTVSSREIKQTWVHPDVATAWLS